jgi:DNA-binding NtrC family response regulator
MPHALLVERHPDLQPLLHLFLVEVGCTVTSLPDLRSCIAHLRRSRTPLLVVVDTYRLPRIPLSSVAMFAMLPSVIPLFRHHVSIILLDHHGPIALYLQRHHPDLPLFVLRKPFDGDQLAATFAAALGRLRVLAYTDGASDSEQ